MAAYSKNKSKAKKKQDPAILKEISYLNKLLEYSLRAADNVSEELDKVFINQANRLKIKIEKLQGKQ